MGRWRDWARKARQLRTEIHALYIASRDPRTPPRAKVLLALIIAYALSPVDLILDSSRS